MVIYFNDGGELDCSDITFTVNGTLLADDIYEYPIDNVDSIEGDVEVVYSDGGSLVGSSLSFWGDELVVDDYRTVPISSVESITEGYDDTDFDWDFDYDEEEDESDFIEEGCHGKRKKKRKVLTQKKKKCGEECNGEGCHAKRRKRK